MVEWKSLSAEAGAKSREGTRPGAGKRDAKRVRPAVNTTSKGHDSGDANLLATDVDKRLIAGSRLQNRHLYFAMFQ